MREETVSLILESGGAMGRPAFTNLQESADDLHEAANNLIVEEVTGSHGLTGEKT